MNITGIPDGWELVRVGSVTQGERYIGSDGRPREWDSTDKTICQNYIIITRIAPIDPGEGFRFIDPKIDTRRSSDEYWWDSQKCWNTSNSDEFSEDMIYRRRIETEPKYIPWTRETCPIGAVIVGPIDNVLITRCNKEFCYLVSTGYVSFSDILQSAYRLDGKPCGTEVHPMSAESHSR